MLKLCKCGCGQKVKETNDYIHGHNRQGLVSCTSGERWAINYDCCTECGTTESPHAGKGLCKKCYKRNLYLTKKEKLGRWSRSFDECIECGKTDFTHRAKGLCSRCYDKKVNFKKGIKVRNFGAWSWYHEKCTQCGTTTAKHAKGGLCYDCDRLLKRDKASCVACPVCGILVNKLSQHLTMKSKKCNKHYEYQKDMLYKYFTSDLNLEDISEELDGMDRHAVTKQFIRFFGKEETIARNEIVRRCNISEKAVINHNKNNRFGTIIKHDSPEQGVIKLRSKLEAAYADFLDEHNILWLYESKSFPYLDKEGRRRTYTPDFYLPDEDKFIEIKGYDNGNAEYKVNCVRSLGVNIEMIRQGESY